MDDLFIQFYQTFIKQRSSVAGSFLKFGDHLQILTNGFSYVWDYANPVWVELDSDFNVVKLPNFSGYRKVYVSASFFEHVFIVLKWAKENPQVSFVIGGPIIILFTIISEHIPHLKLKRLEGKLPHNLTILDKSAESIFGLSLDPKRFKIVLPNTTTPRLYFFRIENGCYWASCRFCIYKCEKFKNLDLDYETLWNIPPGGIWLGTSSISPEGCEILTRLNYEDRRYHCFMRGDLLVLETLQKVLPRVKSSSNLRFFIGVEFPSNRMLKMMNKGTNIETLAKVIHILTDAKCKLTLSFITRWGCLQKSDIKEAVKFFEMLPDGSKYDCYYTKLLDWFSDISPNSGQKGHQFFNKLTHKQELLDNQWLNILHEHDTVKLQLPSNHMKQRMAKFKEFTEQTFT